MFTQNVSFDGEDFQTLLLCLRQHRAMVRYANSSSLIVPDTTETKYNAAMQGVDFLFYLTTFTELDNILISVAVKKDNEIGYLHVAVLNHVDIDSFTKVTDYLLRGVCAKALDELEKLYNAKVEAYAKAQTEKELMRVDLGDA